MSFPIDYRFYGKSIGVKYALIGNAVPPKLSYAIAIAILRENNTVITSKYLPIQHNPDIPFINLNGMNIPKKIEKAKKKTAKFKYHIPYLIIDAYRVELTNYNSHFERHKFHWSVELHHGQGRNKARKYSINVSRNNIPSNLLSKLDRFLNKFQPKLHSFDEFQTIFCMTEIDRVKSKLLGPYELLQAIRNFIDKNINESSFTSPAIIAQEPYSIPFALQIGHYILQTFLDEMKRRSR